MDPLPLPDHPAAASYVHAARESRARLRLAQGRAADAALDLLPLGRDLEAIGIVNPSIAPWRSLAATALPRADETPRALLDEEVTLARRWGAPRAIGIALRTARLVTGDLALVREAVAVLERA